MVDLRRVRDLWRRSDVTVRDLSLALFLFAASFVPAFHGSGGGFVVRARVPAGSAP